MCAKYKKKTLQLFNSKSHTSNNKFSPQKEKKTDQNIVYSIFDLLLFLVFQNYSSLRSGTSQFTKNSILAIMLAKNLYLYTGLFFLGDLNCQKIAMTFESS